MLGYNGFIQETEDAAALALGRNGFIQPVEEQGAPPPVASVVPASQVVADDREDEALTQAGLIAAIAALPASGGDIYIGAGTLALTSTITIDRDIRIFGAGVGNTLITMTGPFAMFTVGDFYVTLEDVLIQGDAGVTDQVIFNFTSASSKPTYINRVIVGTSFASTAACVRTIFDLNSFERKIWIDNSALSSFCGADHTLDFFIKDGTTGSTFRMTKSQSGTGGAITGFPALYLDDCDLFAIFSGQALEIGVLKSNGGSVTGNAGAIMTIRAMETNGTNFASGGAANNMTIGATGANSCRIKGGQITINIVAAGAGIHLIGVAILASCTFTSTSLDNHIIEGCSFTSTAAANVLLADSDGNVVGGNVLCRVTESGTSDSNRYSDIASTSTIIGQNSVVTDAQVDELEVLVSNVASSTYATSSYRYIPLSKVAAPNEEYIQLQIQARRAGRLRIYLDYAPSVSNGGNVKFDYSGLALLDGDNPDGALSSAGSDTFTPGAGATRKTIVIDTAIDLVPGNDVLYRITRSDDAGDTHTGSMNILTAKAVVW